MKKQIGKTDYDCYVVIDSIRGIERVSLYCIKEAVACYHVAEDYCLYDGGISFEDAVYNWPFARMKDSHSITRRNYAQLVSEIDAIKTKIIEKQSEGTVIHRDILKAGDCIKYTNGYLKFIKIEDNNFEASGLSVGKWCARHCSRITGQICEHLPEEVILIDEKELLLAEGMLRSSVEALKNDIINKYSSI